MRTCAPTIHTKECDYLGLTLDTSTYCKNPLQLQLLVFSVLEVQGAPWNQHPGEEPATIKQFRL